MSSDPSLSELAPPGVGPGETTLPRWLWLWLPIGYLLVEMGVCALDGQGGLYRWFFSGERGFVEIATAVLLVPALILGVCDALRARRERGALSSALLWLFALGCLFLLGEETSWGQHFLGWQSPEYFEAYNRQNETNIHNLEFFDRNLLKWAVVVGILGVGVILPLFFRRHGVPDRLARSALGPLLIHGPSCLPTAAIAATMHLLVKVLHWLYDFEFHENGFIDMRETTELYIAFFLFLYALALWRRLDVAAGAGTRVRRA